jgi:hypothetical protein
MQFPTWLKPGIYGAIAGALIITAAGFTSLGWTTRDAAEASGKKQAALAVVSALMPFCMQKSSSDPAAVTVLAEMKAASSYARRDILVKAGWASPFDPAVPNVDLAQACQLELNKAS